jgi:carboxyl-terminal processing protease
MKISRLAFSFLILIALSCNTVTQALYGTPTPPPTPIPAPTATVEASPTLEAPPTAETSPELAGTATPAAGGGFFDSVYVPPSCQNRVVGTVAPGVIATQATPIIPPNPQIDQATQLAVFDALVAKVNEVYVYPDFNGVDWKGIIAKHKAAITAGLDTEAFYLDMEHLIAELNDDHSQFQSPSILAASNVELSGKNDYVGIGVVILPEPDRGLVTILSVFPDSAAEHAGLKQHDSILAVDGTPIVQNGQPLPRLVRGPECTAVRLTVQSPGGQPHDIALVRYRITAPEPVEAKLVSTADGSRIGYIFIPTFYDETIPGQVRDALNNFGKLDGLILDNRMNPGGSSDVVAPIFGYFTGGVVGHFVGRRGQRPLNITGDPVQNSDTVPLVILVGKGTASFGEIFSGTMQDIGRAKLVGENTAGLIELLHGYDFKDGSRAWIAEERYDPLNSHANWKKTGITPDVVVTSDWADFTFSDDPSLVAALKLLGHQ